MGCFFGCFRVRDDRRGPVHLLSQPISSTAKDPLVSAARNPLSSLLLYEAEGRDESSPKDRKCSVSGSVATDINLQELKAEAKFLKNCGTLPQTPAEIRNYEKLTSSKPQNGDTESTAFHSWLQNATGIEKIKLEKEPCPESTPVKLFEEWENKSDASSHSPDSCVTGRSAEGGVVRHSLESKSSGYPSDYSVSKTSPYPTPLSLTNDMQTPGTVLPSHLQNKEIERYPRRRSQYMQPVLTPVENAAQLKKLVEESYCSDGYSGLSEEHFERGASTAGKELNDDTSLSSWLPPKQKTNLGGNNQSFTRRTPVDRPILGMVATHWNADEIVESPPKWWDGNGIPNSTNKYKEDQKVSWHATPFEERLEKALSEDRLIAERKQLGITPLRPVDLNENEDHEPLTIIESGLILTV